MLISVEKRFVFVANTKTASTSIEHTLMPHSDIFRGGTPERKHIPMRKILNVYGFLFDQPDYRPESFFRFGVMRDPLDWIGSWFRFRKGNNVESPLPADMSFEEFWAAKDWNIMRAGGRKHLQRQMFCAGPDQVLVDVIIPYHRLGEMFGEICDVLKITSPLARKNVSRLNDKGTIPDALKDEMRAFYARDYELFDQLDRINAAGMDKLRRMTG